MSIFVVEPPCVSLPRCGLPNRLAHVASTSIASFASPRLTQTRDKARCVFYAPPGANLSTTQVGIRVDSCHSSSVRTRLVIRTRIQSLIQRERQPTSFINISDLPLMRCFVPKSEEFVSEEIFSTVSSLLRTASCPFCLSWTVPHWNQCAVESGRLYPGLWQTPELHRLCCCTVASVQFCFGGAGGDTALLLRPSLDQVCFSCKVMPR